MADFKRAVYEKWEHDYHQPFDEEFEQKRRLMLHRILREVIENELEETDKLIAKMYWYDELKQSEIALTLGLSPCYVSRHLRMCRDIVNLNMKYVLKFYKYEGRC
jgi:RNA polymerase sigma factor (sigma-70 family)